MTSKDSDRPRKEKLSIYLAKAGVSGDDALIKTENAKSPIAIELAEGQARLYIKREPPKPSPPWTKLFTSLPGVSDDAFGSTNSVGAVLVYQDKRTFLLSFGHGFHLIKDEAMERDFGLRVTLNSVEPGKLRSLDKASYAHNPLNSRTQSAKDLDIFELEMDSEMEMLYAVTGASKEPIFGSHVTGRDSLTLLVETDINGIGKILSTALKKYSETLPQEFEWVENINKVRDSDELGILDLYLDDTLSKPPYNSIWLGEPEIVDWESQIGYSFDLRPKTLRHVVLQLDDLLEYLQQKGLSTTVESLKAQSIHINNSEYQSSKCWPAYRCLYAEIAVGQEQFILRNGTWYRVKAAFLAKLDQYLAGIPKCSINFPLYAHNREDEYNIHVVAHDPSFQLMDKKNIAVGGPYDKIEFCDLIKDSTNLVHVKYYRSSSTLSHLFSQANVAAETFVKDEDFRLRLNSILPTNCKLTDPNQRPDASAYKIIYAIATTKTIPIELPFFSKVTLKNAFKTLRALNFQVELSRIQVDPALLKTSKCKPN